MSEDIKGTNEDGENFSLSWYFKGTTKDGEEFLSSEYFRGTHEDGEEISPSEDFKGTNEDGEEFLTMTLNMIIARIMFLIMMRKFLVEKMMKSWRNCKKILYL